MSILERTTPGMLVPGCIYAFELASGEVIEGQFVGLIMNDRHQSQQIGFYIRVDCGEEVKTIWPQNITSIKRTSNFDSFQGWKKAILGLLKTFPIWETGGWLGDKEGWGFNFELIKWLHQKAMRKAYSIRVGHTTLVVLTNSEITVKEVRRRLNCDDRLAIHIREVMPEVWEFS